MFYFFFYIKVLFFLKKTSSDDTRQEFDTKSLSKTRQKVRHKRRLGSRRIFFSKKHKKKSWNSWKNTSIRSTPPVELFSESVLRGVRNSFSRAGRRKCQTTSKKHFFVVFLFFLLLWGHYLCFFFKKTINIYKFIKL